MSGSAGGYGDKVAFREPAHEYSVKHIFGAKNKLGHVGDVGCGLTQTVELLT